MMHASSEKKKSDEETSWSRQIRGFLILSAVRVGKKLIYISKQ
jgi:hypothetical protein